MSDHNLLTAEQFAERKFDLPQSGKWHELDGGRLKQLQPPVADHGLAVLNLSKAVGDWVRGRGADVTGYACFEPGLIVKRNPDSVMTAAMAWFETEQRFDEFDRIVTDTCPRLVVELASTNDRRRLMRRRVDAYHRRGVELVWVIDPIERAVTTLPHYGVSRRFSDSEWIDGESVLKSFSVSVQSLFVEPEWVSQ